jgi:hypothetical protein
VCECRSNQIDREITSSSSVVSGQDTNCDRVVRAQGVTSPRYRDTLKSLSPSAAERRRRGMDEMEETDEYRLILPRTSTGGGTVGV